MTKSLLAFIGTLSVATAFMVTSPGPYDVVGVNRRYHRKQYHQQKQDRGTDSSSTSTSTSLQMIFLSMDELTEAISSSRSEFYFWFFGASGSASIARGQLPKMYDQVQKIQNLKGLGPTLGGENIGLNPLCGYPEDLAIADVQQVINNPESIEDIIRKYPNDGSFLAQKGYLTYMAFAAANKKSNPLTIRAIFDTFSQSTDSCSPEVAKRKLEEYRKDVGKLSNALLFAKVSGWMSVATLLFLLGLADIVAAGHAYDGWFPEWPGGRNFPFSLFDVDGALWDIPKYWV